MRWHDWLVLITSGALIWGAVSAFGVSHITLSQQGADGAYHDTYYVIAHGHYVLTAISIGLLAVVLHVALIRRSTPFMAASGAIAFCVFALGISLMIAPQMFLGSGDMPRRYIDYPDAFARWQMLSTLGGSLAFAALVTLLSLSLRAWVHRRRSR